MLDFWGQTRATVLANEESAIASRFNREVVAITTEVAVANAYFDVLGAQDRLRIAYTNLAEANRVLQVIRDRFSQGTASQPHYQQTLNPDTRCRSGERADRHSHTPPHSALNLTPTRLTPWT